MCVRAYKIKKIFERVRSREEEVEGVVGEVVGGYETNEKNTKK